jgi:hypothetical protein
MTAQLLLRVLTVAAALFCLSALLILFVRTLSFGRREELSEPRGKPDKGVLYAFGRGMLDKESVALHRLTFVAGILYHGAVFTAFLYLFWVIFLPSALRPLPAFRAVLLIGTAVGIGLLVKRTVKPHLRRLSCPDDFFANLFIDLFLSTALLHTFIPVLEPVLLAGAILLFIYIPLGKIRHCFFFFFTRLAFGVRFGRRGTLPGSAGKV